MAEFTVAQPKQRATSRQSNARSAAADPFVADQPWSPDRPETLVVCCSDGRWHAQVEQFVRDRVSERADLYAVPGGPVGFSWRNSSFDEAKVAEKAVRFLAEHHDLESVWLIAHQHCAYYQSRFGPLDEEFIYRRQLDDLARATAMISRWCPNLLVRRVYASLADGRVVFKTLADEWT